MEVVRRVSLGDVLEPLPEGEEAAPQDVVIGRRLLASSQSPLATEFE
jgi:hypothetical protein